MEIFRELQGELSELTQAAFEYLALSMDKLPPSGEFTGVDPLNAVKLAADDFGALENLRWLLFNEQVPQPEQLALWA